MLGIAVAVGVVGAGTLFTGALLIFRPTTPRSLIEGRPARLGSGIALTIIGVVLLWLSYIWLTTPLI